MTSIPEFLMFSNDFSFSSAAKSQANVVASFNDSSTAVNSFEGIFPRMFYLQR